MTKHEDVIHHDWRYLVFWCREDDGLPGLVAFSYAYD